MYLNFYYKWLKHVVLTLDSDGAEYISWAAYHANLIDPAGSSKVALTSLLPLFHHQANSVAMIRHSMDVVKAAISSLNPGQVPIITCDQPLYALAKQIQWNWPAVYGEEYFFVMFGGMHIEMAALLESSGWTEALVQAGVATAGTADSFVKVSHLTRTRRTHQVTASSLYLLLEDAYSGFCKEIGNDSGQIMSLEKWCTERAGTCPQFQFWHMVLKLQLLVMIYIRAIREGDFQLYVDALTKLFLGFLL